MIRKWTIAAIISQLMMTAFFAFSGCVGVAPLLLDIRLPERPALQTCISEAGVEGRIVNNEVVLSLDDARRLKDHISALAACGAINAILLEGHIEKLENRLRALGAK
jgi:hypothetical protein